MIGYITRKLSPYTALRGKREMNSGATPITASHTVRSTRQRRSAG